MKALILLQNLDAHIVGSNFLLLQWFLQVLQYQSDTESAYHTPRTIVSFENSEDSKNTGKVLPLPTCDKEIVTFCGYRLNR